MTIFDKNWINKDSKKIFFAIPCKTGQLEWVTVASLLQAQMICDQQGWQTRHEVILYDSVYPNACNVLIAKFLKTDCTDMFWVDDDVGFSHTAFIKMMETPLAFVCVPYRHKTDAKETYISPALSGRMPGMVQVAYCGTGCTKMSRTVLERMILEFPESYYPDALPDLKCPALFQIPYVNGSFDGADVTFCNKWRAIGGEIWAFTGEFTEHVGKKSYAGTFTAA